ncbi:MAG: hypothetical protein U0871_29875 [Gemmataceae bacterium]
MVGLIREKMIVQQFDRVKAAVYVLHPPRPGGRGAARLRTGKPSGPTDETLRDVCAHIAA